MARTTPRPQPTGRQTRQPRLRPGPLCGGPLWAASYHDRTVTTLTGVLRLRRTIRRCLTPACPQFQKPSRPAEAGRYTLPKHAFGRDVIALVGTLRDAQPRRVSEIQQEWRRRHVGMAPRTVLPLLARDAALVALSWADPTRLQPITPTPMAGASWRAMGSNPTSGLRSAGACAMVSPPQCSWPAAGCRPPRKTWLP
jgi:hypothetical protein